MKRGEIWWAELEPPAGRRPVVLLSRDEAYAVRSLVVIAPLTTRVRGIPTEVSLAVEDGMPQSCVANLDVITTVPKDCLRSRLVMLSPKKLMEIEGIGPKVAQSVYDWFQNNRNVEFLEKLGKAGIEIEIPHKFSGEKGKFFGKTFVFTGGLEKLTRDEAKEKIIGIGGNISETVNNKTDYVVAGIEPGSKYDKAKKLGIKSLNEKEFLKII